MKQRKVPMRTCVVSKQKFEKKDLLRIVRTPQKEVVVDLSGKLNGKGAYLKKDVDVINKAKKTKVLDRVLEINVDDKIYEEILKIVQEEQK